MTSKSLEKLSVPYRIVIEPQEYEQYASVIDADKILVLPFSNLGQGSIPARNWIWEHSIAEGHKRHWILDDNIGRFGGVRKNKRFDAIDGSVFRAAEDYTERYQNVALSGMQYRGFLAAMKPTRAWNNPFLLNTRIYSCILICNDIPFRWRGRYNEDTDLSLEVLKAGYCTILFYSFFCDKITTMKMRGGNTDELYQGDGRLEMAKPLVRQHPDVARITYRWARYQHYVDYRRFKHNKLKLAAGL